MAKEKKPQAWDTEIVQIDSLKPHPKNYRKHPEEQLRHIEASLQEHGVYRNVVIAKDGTILAGHGVVEAATRLGMKELPVKRLPIAANSTAAAKVIAADNEISTLAEDDDKLLAELLQQAQYDGGLLGTGHDESSLMKLLAKTTPKTMMDADGIDASSGLAQSQQRQVTIFLTPEQHAEWGEGLRKMAAKYETDTVTDTLLAMMRGALTP